jgi:heme-degrading monooxygenase HmoA
MPIARLIFVTVDPKETQEAQRIWKEDCAPLMIKQDGCLSEELLEGVDNKAEFVSYSEWADNDAIKRYEASDAHATIERESSRIKVTDPPVVKRFVVAG